MAQAPSPLKDADGPMRRDALRRPLSLSVEITLSLVVKVVALTAIGMLLFGADRRPEMDAATMGAALTGDQP
jgi:hypothetical protein